MIGRKVLLLALGALAGAAALVARKPTLSQRKPPGGDWINPTEPPSYSPGGSGVWASVSPRSDGSYNLLRGYVYRAQFEVMGVASWFDSESAVRGKAAELGVPLARVQALGGDRYAVESTPLSADVTLEAHPAVKVEWVKRWQVTSLGGANG